MFRVGKCRISAERSEVYSTVYVTVQCGVQWNIIYNTVQCAMQTPASHTRLWTLYSTMCNAVYRPVQHTVILQHSVFYSSVQGTMHYSTQYSAMCNANTSIAYNTIVWTLYSTMCNAVYVPLQGSVAAVQYPEQYQFCRCARESRKTGVCLFDSVRELRKMWVCLFD